MYLEAGGKRSPLNAEQNRLMIRFPVEVCRFDFASQCLAGNIRRCGADYGPVHGLLLSLATVRDSNRTPNELIKILSLDSEVLPISSGEPAA